MINPPWRSCINTDLFFNTCVCVLSAGRGPQREMYLEKLRSMTLKHVAFRSLWLEAADYPLLLGACDVGVSLHASSSGLDLPMKVSDMGFSVSTSWVLFWLHVNVSSMSRVLPIALCAVNLILSQRIAPSRIIHATSKTVLYLRPHQCAIMIRTVWLHAPILFMSQDAN